MTLASRSYGRQPTASEFYSDVAYRTRESQKTITLMAKEVASHLSEVSTVLDGVVTKGSELLSTLQKTTKTYTVEQEAQLVSNFEDAEENLCELHNMLKERENAAVCDHELHSNNESVVVCAYKATMRKIVDLIQVIQDIRWEVMAHAEDYNEHAGEASSVEDLIKALG